MANINIPREDLALDNFLARFATAMAKHATVLGFEPDDTQACLDASTNFHGDLEAVEDAKATLKASVRTKTSSAKSGTATARSYAGRIKSNPAATNQILADFGFSVTPAGSGPVQIPANLTANTSGNGTAKLKWSRNNNAPGTVFLIESSVDGAWVFLGSATRTTFTDTAATPGIQKSYRVRAQRGSVTSEPSNVATIYLESGGSSLKLAA